MTQDNGDVFTNGIGENETTEKSVSESDKHEADLQDVDVGVIKPREPKHAKTIRVIILVVILLAAMLTAAWMTKRAYLNNDTFDITFYRVGSDKLKSNMRTVVVSDLHMSRFGKDNEDLMDAIERLRPDFITVTGDLNTYGMPGGMEFACHTSAQLVSIAPTYYVMGNHEVDLIIKGNQDLKAALTETGVTLLNNRIVTTVVNGNTVSIGGLTQRYDEREKYAPNFTRDMSNAEGYRILLTHYPQSFIQGLWYEDADLAICGHAHGGQIRLPFLGAMYTPDQGLFPKLTEGMHEFYYMTLVVSRGLGNNFFIPRVNNRPELVVIDMSTY